MSIHPCLRICGGEADALALTKPIVVTSEYVFKEIFLDTVTVRGFLESLLVGENKLFPIGSKIEKIELASNEPAQPGKYPGQQKTRMIIDIKIKSNTKIYIIEMQKRLGREIKRFFNEGAVLLNGCPR